MPRKYKRKEGVRARVVSWTTEQLQSAFHELDKKELGINEISRQFGIPSRTLRRRYAIKNQTKLTLGKHPVLGFEHEKRLVAHILKLSDAGFPPDRRAIRTLAYQFAEKLQIQHNFDNENQMAGNEWFKSFIERNPELSIRQAEGLSVARAKGLSREEVNNFHELLTKVLADNDLLDKPERIYNMDESGVQLNNKPGKVVAKKGAKVVNSVTSAEKGETMTIVACCNAIGNFLPPVVIIKGVNKKPEFENGLPLGSKVYMNKKSAYINTDLFYKWLTEHFIALKPQGKVLLILDGHSSHSSAPDMLQVASDNDIILLCLPSHTTSALQPLDVAVFGPFKTYFNHETNQFMRANPNKKISRYNAGTLIRNAWIRATTPANALAGFRRSGIYPLNPNALPDSVFTISDIAHRSDNDPDQPCVLHQTTTALLQTSLNENAEPCEHVEVEHRTQTTIPPISSIDCPTTFENEYLNVADLNITPPNMPSTSFNRNSPSLLIDPQILEDTIIDIVDIGDDSLIRILDNEEKETPSKFLVEASPIPQIPLTLARRAKQSADILNSREKIKEKRDIADRKKKQIESKIHKTEATKKRQTIKKANKKTKEQIQKNKNKKGKPKKNYDSSEETDGDVTDCSHKENDYYLKVNKDRGLRKRLAIYSSNSENEDHLSPNTEKGKKTIGLPVKKTKKNKFEEPNSIDENVCVECFDTYNNTKSKSDWIQCIMCQKWLHETCTLFKNYCSRCGKLKMSGST